MTYNIHNFMSNQQRDELVAHLKAFKHPTRANVIMDDPDLVRRFRREFPKAITIYRKYFPGEFGDNNSQEKIDANGWANVYQTEMPASEGAYWYCNNEAALTDKNAAFLEACARRTIELGGRGVFGNFSVGTPEKDDWRKLNGLLRLMAQYPDRLILAVHEYFPTLWTVGVSGTTPHPSQWPAKINGAGDLVARIRRLFEHCDAEGIKRPLVIITESSSDRIHDVGIWQQSLKRAGNCDISGPWFCNVPQWEEWGQAAGMTWEQYAFAQLQAVWNAVYRHDPNVIDWCHFCWGADPGSVWRGFDLMYMPPSFRESMEQGNWPMSTPTPTPTVTPNAWANGTSPAVNVRSSPNGAVVRTITDKGELAKLGAFQTVGTYNWYEYTFLNGVKGWIRDDVHEAEALKPSVSLNVPYKKQFGDSTNDDRINDCAAACIAMLLGFHGVDKTVDEVTAVINQPEGTVHFKYLTPAILSLGFKSEVRQGTHLTDIIKSLNEGKPMMVLVNYMHLRGGNTSFNYGHFVVPIGYEFDGKTLTLIVHDPYNAASMRFSSSTFVKAIGEMEGTGNTAFQSLFFTGRVTPPPPSGDESPALIRLATIHREIAALAAEATTILSTIKG